MHYTLGMKTKQLVLVLAMSANCMGGDLEDCCGGVYGKSAVIVAPDMAITEDGPIVSTGTGFITPKGSLS